MTFRTRLLALFAPFLALATAAGAANLDGSTPGAGNAEAARLYANANDYVSNMAEGQYSYLYLQFYWKRAQSNVDRIRHVYPDSPTAKALAQGDAKLGPYPLDYFRERVLYNLEVKRIAAFDDVNCAIFLYGRDPGRNDTKRDEALAEILEVLARRQRWGEALRFPVLAVHRPLLLRSIFRVAANYGVDEEVQRLTALASPAEQKAAGFDPILAESLALRGVPREALYSFLADHPDPEVRAAALQGVVERELLIRRSETLHLALGASIQTVHLVVQNTSLRDDVPAVARRIYPGDADGAAEGLAAYFAGLGTAPLASAPVAAHLAYLRYLADAGRLDAVGTYVRDSGVRGPTRPACRLKVIELEAEAGQQSEADQARVAFAAAFSPGADDAAFAEFRGRMNATDPQLVVRRNTFADLPVSDPCVMAAAIMEWSLTPNRSQRGATPWDAIVTRFAGGFDHLPKPASAVVGDAASTLKPY